MYSLHLGEQRAVEANKNICPIAPIASLTLVPQHPLNSFIDAIHLQLTHVSTCSCCISSSFNSFTLKLQISVIYIIDVYAFSVLLIKAYTYASINFISEKKFTIQQYNVHVQQPLVFHMQQHAYYENTN